MNKKSQSATALRRLMTEYKQLTTNGSPDSMFTAGPVSEDNFFEWEALINGPKDTPYEGGVFVAKLEFPSDYPLNPFKMKFDPPLLHPNVYADGNVCISILHSPGDDPNMYELASERWSPVQSVEKVLLSVISMLAEPNLESGANVDCCKLYRENKAEFERQVRASFLCSYPSPVSQPLPVLWWLEQMYEGDVVVISSSPEPEPDLPLRSAKGKARATTRRSNLDQIAPVVLDDDDQPVASGSGSRDAVDVQAPHDPIEATMQQVLDVIPNVERDHLLSLVAQYITSGHHDAGTAIISQLLENPGYPKAGKRKSEAVEASTSKRVKVDYLAEDRVAMSDVGYISLSLDYLIRVDFPTIPKDYITRKFFDKKSLYAPTYIVLKQDLKDGTKFVAKKSTKRTEKSRGKAKAPRESEDFEMERIWLLEYLGPNSKNASKTGRVSNVDAALETIHSLGWSNAQTPICSAENALADLLKNVSETGKPNCCAWTSLDDHLPKSCEEAEKDKALDGRHAIEEAMSINAQLPQVQPEYVVRIPRLRSVFDPVRQGFVKESGCNKMKCPKCASLVCYVCRQIIRGYDHFDQTPQGVARNPKSKKCPLWESLEQRHADEVKQAAEVAREEYRRLNPEVREEDIVVELPQAPAPPAPAPTPALLPRVGPIGQALNYAFPMHYAGPPQPQPAQLIPQGVFARAQQPRGFNPYQQQMLNIQAERARRAAAEGARQHERARLLAAQMAENARQVDQLRQLLQRNQAALAPARPARRARRR
ncbi:unnamed protein product [Rhizoctonia solani]|uniref:E2 ubiquitin-conjugating enzyme n=1 Tax=Rhizoctonia solani TaxID=456999 RepID=A0A8H3ABG7_9AGAM|nr:unnamed protein product [Rhizoctonia solani]